MQMPNLRCPLAAFIHHFVDHDRGVSGRGKLVVRVDGATVRLDLRIIVEKK